MHIATAFVTGAGLGPALTAKLKTLVVNSRESCFLSGASDVGAIEALVQQGLPVYGSSKLHAKVYLAPPAGVLITSANLTYGGLYANTEAGVLSSERSAMDACRAFLNELLANPFTLPLDRVFTDRIRAQPRPVAGTLLAPDSVLPVGDRSFDDVPGSTWKEDVLELILQLGRRQFTLEELYFYEPILRKRHPSNQHIRDKVRQVLQQLRDGGLLEFLGQGSYQVLL